MNRADEAFNLVREKGLTLFASVPTFKDNFKTLVTLTEAYAENVLAGSERKQEVEGDIARGWITAAAFARLKNREFGEACETVGKFLHECERGNVVEAMPMLLVELIEREFTPIETE